MAVAVGAYFGAALLQATIAGIFTFIVLSILGVPSPLALAVVIATLDLIPLVGATLGAILVGIVTLFNDFPTVTIIWAIWAIVYQQVENYVIQPRIQGRAVQLDPFIIVIAALFGGTLLGIIGALVAIPLAAAGQIGVREFLVFRRAGLMGDTTAAWMKGTADGGGEGGGEAPRAATRRTGSRPVASRGEDPGSGPAPGPALIGLDPAAQGVQPVAKARRERTISGPESATRLPEVLTRMVQALACGHPHDAGVPPAIRVRGRITPLEDYPPLTPQQTRDIVYCDPQRRPAQALRERAASSTSPTRSPASPASVSTSTSSAVRSAPRSDYPAARSRRSRRSACRR